MPEIRPEIETIAKIKVVGVGGAGNSAINRMIASKIRGVEFIAVNTDIQALHQNQAKHKLHIGKNTTKGLGAGMNPEAGFQAAQENLNEIRDMLKGSDMVFVTCGLGGGTGTGATPVVAQVAKEIGALTIAVVTKPFTFEGAQRSSIAERGFNELKDKVDAIITIPNDRIFQAIDKKTSVLDAFKVVDDILRQGVQGISELITIPGLVNLDFNDVKTIMQDTGSALMGIGESGGENRSVTAAKMAISSPLLDISIEGARGILYIIVGGNNLAMSEIQDAAKIISESADDNAKIIFGAAIDESLKDKIRITVIATGFGEKDPVKKVAQKSHAYTPNPIFVRKTVEDKSGFGSGERNERKEPENFSQPRVSSFVTEEVVEKPIAKNADVVPSSIIDEDEDLEIPAFLRRKMK
ncbi:MAG: cell division protein FtsZ [Candidatus Buchananbacteria bacterium]